MTASRTAALGGNVIAGTGRPLTLIGGPCVIESESLVMEVAERLVDITSRLGIQYV
jgi:2-dehydro-3-deoxyphosphooctonate aldolase (KDO 8-P synthase)